MKSTNKEEINMNHIIRQGDVMLVKVGTQDLTDFEKVKRDSGRVVLAYGEVTGHAHAIHERHVALYVNPKQPESRILRVEGNVCYLKHEEHSKHALSPGDYKVITQREYHPDELRPVAD